VIRVAIKRHQKNRALRRARQGDKINLDSVGPKIAAGLTQGASAEEAFADYPVQQHADGAALASALAQEPEYVGRVPAFQAVLRDDTNSVWQEHDGRLQRNVIASVKPEVFQALQSGYMCLRCYEPQEEGFPDQCDMCGYPMQERQIMDVAMEFRGQDHVGPALPIGRYLDEQDERVERSQYEADRQGGKSPMKSISRRILSPGVKRLRGLAGNVKVDDAIIKASEKVISDGP